MSCGRCGGFLVEAELLEGAGLLPASRCTSCGDILDAVIFQHRPHWREPYGDPTLPVYEPAKRPRLLHRPPR